ncbi:winged helix-turn-helix domain-containing protein [Rossellomorea aquimaris]|uniref:ArsR/SmtB family transcription factor n=1 Tax=Rossellomorea aquimaris TaxID=189382 RepID=UPI001CD6DEC9|nr:winged helix-turn-helix domain-containing protein [Rossellomorea aquimaris]MCA1053769.1 winged helix-turn-helix domain-containing protein [Rossellomorea aquimaris]
MKSMFIIKEYDQLKALSDPFRIKLMMRLVEKPYTGQQLSELFEMSRARIHYHLKELEKLGLIEIVKTEEKNGILQKFFQSVSSGFYPDASLLPHKEEISETKRLMMYGMMERTMGRILEAPSSAFDEAGDKDPSEWNILASSWETVTSEENFKWFVKEYFQLVGEFQRRAREEEEVEQNTYYLTGMGFEVAESKFSERIMEKEKDR